MSRSSQDARDDKSHLPPKLHTPVLYQPIPVPSSRPPEKMGFGAAIEQTINAAEKRKVEKERAANELFGVGASMPPPAVRREDKEKRQDTPIPGFKSSARPAGLDLSLSILSDQDRNSSSSRAPPTSTPSPPPLVASSKMGFGAAIDQTINAAEKRRIEKERATNELFGLIHKVPSNPSSSAKENTPPTTPFESRGLDKNSHPSTVAFLSQKHHTSDLLRHNLPQISQSIVNVASGGPRVEKGKDHNEKPSEVDCWGNQLMSKSGSFEYAKKEENAYGWGESHSGKGSISLSPFPTPPTPPLDPQAATWGDPRNDSPPASHKMFKPLSTPSPGVVDKPMSIPPPPDTVEERLFFAGLPHDLSPWWWYSFSNSFGQQTVNGPFGPERMAERWRKGSFQPGVKLVGLDPALDLRFPPPQSFFKSLEDLEKLCSVGSDCASDLLGGTTCYQPFTSRDNKMVNEEGMNEPEAGWNTVLSSPPSLKRYIYGKDEMMALKLDSPP